MRGKRIIAAGIFSCMCIQGISACTKQDSNENENIYVGVTYYDQSDTYLNELIDCFKEELGELETGDRKVSVTIQGAGGAQRTQNDQVKELIDGGCNVLCVNLVDRTDPSEIIDMARENDVPLIFFNREPVEEDMRQWEKLYYVGADAEQSGTMQGELAAEIISANPHADRNKDGKIQYVVLEGEPGHQDTIIRTESAVEALKDNGVELEKLSYGLANWNRAQAENRMTQMISQYQTKIELVLANNDEMALGAIDAYEKLNYTESTLPLFFGIDGTDVGLEAVRDGRLSGTVYNDKEGQAEAMANLAAALVSGTGMEEISFDKQRYIYLPYSKVKEEQLGFETRATPWEADSYFLCGTEDNFDAGIEIFDTHGESVLQMSRAVVMKAVLSDGTLLNRSAGVLPPDSVLFITSGQNVDKVKTGAWGVKEKKWLIQPEEGYLKSIEKDGKMTSFVLNNVSYGMNFKQEKRGAGEIYEFSDGAKLKNISKADGNYYIGTVEGECYLDGNTFYERNCDSGIPLTKEDSIRIEKSVAGQYMVVEYTYTEVRSDTDILLSTKSYLCDLNGVIQYPEWNYDGVNYVSDQFDHKDIRYLVFSNDEELPFHYLDIEQNQEVIFPDGYGRPLYVGNGFFRLEDDETCTIYDAVEKKIGTTFMIHPGAAEYILGLDTYLDYGDEKLVIDGIQQKYLVETITEDTPKIRLGTCPVIRYKTISGDIVSCILDARGNLIFETKQDVLYADEFCYLVRKDYEYEILSLP